MQSTTYRTILSIVLHSHLFLSIDCFWVFVAVIYDKTTIVDYKCGVLLRHYQFKPIWTRVPLLPIWTRGGNWLTPLKSLEMRIFQWNVRNFETSWKKLFPSSSLWRHIYVIFHIFREKIVNFISHCKLQTLFIKNLPSSKRWLIIGMDISVPDRETFVLNNNKIPEKSEKLEKLKEVS